ncbi:MAG: hypothetical protein IJ718_00730 [Paludibacteraceae bacterium]|nr:hypothetical protein [Paludibacteraceae bacterium]
MKKTILILIALIASAGAYASSPLENIAEIMKNLGGGAKVLDSDHKGTHLLVQLSDSCQVEVIGDSLTNEVMLIYTSCAPICSSCVRMYRVIDKGEWLLTGDRKPTCGGVFPQAFWENGELIWRDNTPQWLDDEEKNRP